ncbi:MAG: protein-disulfide isomerase [Microgenomates group bacterium GW2011_GWC1_39_7b]|nr:MAG: Protein-disulfide isomerase [Candidatus Woesebacteria bacterium GW2011_GWB1_39_10]KKR26363.1 MAG: protein-disulfide isomerase [Microgenomates group bacterium GW2011_GWC1_39_7b]
MKDIIRHNFVFIAGIIATAVIIIGGVYLFGNNGSTKPNGKQISNDILVPKGSNITSGIVNGKYLPADSSAQLTLVEFGDYQCPACGAYSPLTKQLITEFSGKINYVFRGFSFIGPESLKSAEAADCASDQNKFWEYHDYLYTHQNGENKGTFADVNLKSFANILGMDSKTFDKCLDSGKYKNQVDNSTNDGKLAGVNSTPSFFINGVKMENIPGSYDEFKKLIQNAMNKSPIVQGTPTTAYHGHFDIKVYLNDTRVNLGLAKYQSKEPKELDPYIHLHDGNGNLVHLHKTETTLNQFFNSLKMNFTENCFILDGGKKSCNSESSSLKMYVNGVANTQYQNYVPQDLDRILISFGPVNDKNLTTQINSVTDLSCIYSLRCPERGKPPSENCVGGVGTDCTD